MWSGYFRLLIDGEIVLSSDELIDDDWLHWHPAERWTIGRPWHNGLKPMRRAICAVGATPSVERLSRLASLCDCARDRVFVEKLP